jgi:putative NADH-flavin reductase
MRLLILGATGGIGQLLVRLALERGHEVTAFVRSPEKITLRNERLTIIPGDLLNASQLVQVLTAQDAVLSAFGPAVLRSITTRRDFARALATAMRQSGGRRVVMVSTALLFPKVSLLGVILRRTLCKNIVPDAAGMESEISKDGLDWTIVRPPRLTNGPLTQAYRVVDGQLPEGGAAISRADVADFMLNEIEKPAHRTQIVGMAL